MIVHHLAEAVGDGVHHLAEAVGGRNDHLAEAERDPLPSGRGGAALIHLGAGAVPSMHPRVVVELSMPPRGAAVPLCPLPASRRDSRHPWATGAEPSDLVVEGLSKVPASPPQGHPWCLRRRSRETR